MKKIPIGSTNMLAELIKKSGAPLPDFVKEELKKVLTEEEIKEAEEKTK